MTEVPAHVLRLDHAAAAVEVADHVADMVLRRGDLDVHDRLEDDRAGLLHAFAEAGLGGDFEGQGADESTSWYLPSTRVNLKSTVGKPASTPVSACTLMPLSTAGMYSFGIEPPTTELANSMPVFRSFGSKVIFTSAYWPEPPDCFLWV